MSPPWGWTRGDVPSVMAGRVPATRPQSVEPPLTWYNRQCAGGRDTSGHDGEGVPSSAPGPSRRVPGMTHPSGTTSDASFRRLAFPLTQAFAVIESTDHLA